MHKNKEDEQTANTSKQTSFPANILTMIFDENHKSKLSKLEPNPIPLEQSFSKSFKTQNKTNQKNIYQSININDMTFHKDANKDSIYIFKSNNNNNNENSENNAKEESTLKKSEVTFSDHVIDINSHIKRNSNGNSFFYDMSPAKNETAKLKSVRQHIKTPYSKLRKEDVDSEDFESEKKKLLNFENEKEIKICDEILSVKKKHFVDDLNDENDKEDFISKKDKDCFDDDNAEKSHNFSENVFENNYNNKDNTASEIGVGDCIDFGKVGNKLNLNRKIFEMLNLNNDKFTNILGFTNEKFQEIIESEENETTNNENNNKSKNKLNVNNNSVKDNNLLLIAAEEENKNSKLEISENDLKNPFSNAKADERNDNPFIIVNTTQAKNNSKKPKRAEFSSENLLETIDKEDSSVKNEDANNALKGTKSKILENTLDKIKMYRQKFTPKSILKNSNSNGSKGLDNSCILNNKDAVNKNK